MSDLSRRNCLSWGLAAASALSVPKAYAAQAGTAPASLNAIAASKGFGFGTSIGETATIGEIALLPPEIQSRPRRKASFADPKVRDLTVKECGLLVHENELKWYAVRPDPKTYDFSRADRIVKFAAGNGLAMRGHNLFWNAMRWTPRWVAEYDFGSRPASAAEKMLREHIFKVCTRYGKRIFSYDVINETIDPKTGELEPTPFTKHLGWNVLDICFHAAKEAAPHAELVYNDFPSWGPESTHRTAILKLLDYTKKKNLPVDALGVQSHIGFPNTGGGGSGAERDETAWRKFLGEVSAMGYGLLITEFDINDKSAPTDIAARDREVAALGKAWLDIMLSYPSLRYVMAWGLVDKYSWLQEFIPRADGLPQRCAPYDNKYQPTPLREAFAAAFAAAPLRPAIKRS